MMALMGNEICIDSRLASLYDLFWPSDKREDFRFYLPLVMSARSVLDVSCGTGALLREARERGHAGRLCGQDPAAGMLEVALARGDIEWLLADMTAAPAWDREFDLVVMIGHSFQMLVDDDELRVALARIAAALSDEGRFVFETRNPLARDWENWERYSGDVVEPGGAVVHCACEVEMPARGELVSFTQTYTSPAWDRTWHSRSTLRFLPANVLSGLLSEVGMVVVEQFGDWDRSPLTYASPEIITIARHA
jgi:ubiquinone/menaquinone biosynthesis C-methylase UbiE